MATVREIREQRLKHEFQRMLAIRTPTGLIDFRCSDLSQEEEIAHLTASVKINDIWDKLPGFLPPDEFQAKFPGKAPEKYVVMFRCIGLYQPSEEELKQIDEHLMVVIFGYHYPSKPPRYIWLTPIWHPNIKPPFFCNSGRSFAVATSLDQICLMAGRMIQYSNYNPDDWLNKDAATWAIEHKDQFPIDKRDLLTGQEIAPAMVSLDDDEIEWL